MEYCQWRKIVGCLSNADEQFVRMRTYLQVVVVVVNYIPTLLCLKVSKISTYD